jgi:hypothetical protein
VDVLIKGIPEGITEVQVREWVGVLVERFENQKANNIPEVRAAIVTAQTTIDSFRKANTLQAKFEKPVVKDEEVLTKDVPQG